MSDITNGFIEAMLFAERSCFVSSEFWTEESQDRVNEGQADGSIPSNCYSDSIDAESLTAIEKMCDEFEKNCGDLLDGLDHIDVGHDLYFTYAGHGVGFWESDRWPDGIGDKLDKICGRGEICTIPYQENDETKIQVYIG